MNPTFPWQQAYLDAVLETDNLILPQRIMSARNTIKARVMTLEQDHQGTPEERTAIADALNGLEMLRRERTNDFKDPSSFSIMTSTLQIGNLLRRAVANINCR